MIAEDTLPIMRTTERKAVFLNWFRREDPFPIDIQIEEVLSSMTQKEPGTGEYDQLLTILERLAELRKDHKPAKLSRDTIAIVAGNLLGILLIVGYERQNVITSRGMNFLPPTTRKL